MTVALTTGPRHHFFGYYGVDAWNPSLRHHLVLETDFDDHRPVLEDRGSVDLVDRETGAFDKLAETSAFNLQRGSMMHWVDAGHGAEFTFNDWEDGCLVSRALNTETRQARTIDGAVAAISPVEPVGLGLDFARMAECRAIVGYDSAVYGRAGRNAVRRIQGSARRFRPLREGRASGQRAQRVFAGSCVDGVRHLPSGPGEVVGVDVVS